MLCSYCKSFLVLIIITMNEFFFFIIIIFVFQKFQNIYISKFRLGVGHATNPGVVVPNKEPGIFYY